MRPSKRKVSPTTAGNGDPPADGRLGREREEGGGQVEERVGRRGEECIGRRGEERRGEIEER
ncbi:hypothetical protein D4764_13G0012510 [Takifugu flavidus]|uniref:Uncharacterized protein n=1 Tax=Takifugu flavidus TaxID=433684 RepID=A0A5C6PC84_9TELE|nr:hypothetical protein D4764_13G0012510 [Takifugu flavidus]